MTDELVQRCRDLARDDASGATALTLAAADVLLDAIEAGRAGEIAERIAAAKPAMASLLNLGIAALNAYDPRQAREQVERFRDTLASAPARAGENAAEWIRAMKDRCRVVTISASAAVEATVRDLHRTGTLTGLTAGESQPRREGRDMAMRVRSDLPGLDVKIAYDASLPGLMRPDCVVLFGADAVTEGAVYNKAGSLMLAVVATAWDLPVLSVTTTHKVVPPDGRRRFAAGEREMLARAEDRARAPEDPLYDLPFEAVSRDLLTAVITEDGPLPGPVRKA
ncbi:MAG: hypothetical protein FJ087_09330 [Deltaproteobacteria bacterium]|nr:hypothetical protein [Deltaproteobacteria bacterium]